MLRLKVRDFGTSISSKGGSTVVNSLSTSANQSTGISCSFWIRLGTFSGQTLMQFRQESGNLDCFRINIEGTSKLFLWLVNNVNVGTLGTKPSVFLERNKWYHIVFGAEFNGTDVNMKIYLNSTLIANQTTTYNLRSSDSFRALGNTGDYYDSVTVYDRMITASEVQDIYQNAKFAKNGMAFQWFFNEGSGSTAHDRSGNERHGTITTSTYSTEVPMIPRSFTNSRVGYNISDALNYNPRFENAPTFVAPTTTSSRWIDGTAGGSTTVDTYKWYYGANSSPAVGSAQFDSSVFYDGGSRSLKVVCTTSSTLGSTNGLVVNLGASASPSATIQRAYFIPLDTDYIYRLTFFVKTDTITNVNGGGFRAQAIIYNGISTSSQSSFRTQYVSGTTEWTQYEIIIHSRYDRSLLNIWFQIDGETGTFWVDNIELKKVFQPRNFAGSKENLVLNGAPEFVCNGEDLTTLARYMNGTTAGVLNARGSGWIAGITSGLVVSNLITDTTSPTGSSIYSYAQGGGVCELRSNKTTTYYTRLGFIMKPSTAYKIRYWQKTEYIGGDTASGSDGVYVQLLTANSAGSSSTPTVQYSPTRIKTTTDWTYYEGDFTPNADAMFGHIELRIYCHNGADTLEMKAWWADVEVVEVTPTERTLIT